MTTPDVVAALGEPVEVPRPVLDRVLDASRELTSTPRRAALVTVWCVAVVAVVLALVPSTLSVRTRLGPATVRCGLDAFVYAYPDTAVRDSCRHAEAGRLAVAVPAAVVVAAGLVAALAVVSSRRRLPSPRRLALWAIVAGAALVGVLALRPAVVERATGDGLVTARCGADTYFLGYPEPTIERACRDAYAPRARVLLGSGAVVVLAAGALVASRRRVPWSLARAGAPVVAVAAAVVAGVLLVPIAVEVGPASAGVTARCGIDTVLAGHPDSAVERACRARAGRRSAGALAAIAIAGVAAGVYATTGRQRRVGMAR